ncbi:hypothetical protein SAMN04488003_101298 [Loktanella fryxellensis]|uniref:Glycosyl transferase family 8 n=1 Tax=Loktanella fryxellensis TaxID=245187 RepID=A0A1H7YTE5_9RHOB|nr:hypothetical protein [Loktanella fryxellensis]SEM49171.1 hypothetical protein SAMN04488003_101298 [Loktanella fryxellensis]
MSPIPAIVCLKWGKGYPVRDTNILFRALTDLMTQPFRFVCLTDDPAGLDAGIDAVALPAFALSRDHWTPGMWPKLSVFAPGLFAPGTPVLLMDVDVVVARDLSPLIDRIRQVPGLHIIHDWHDTHERWFPRLFPRVRGSNSSVVGFVAGTQAQIWDRFHTQDFDTLRSHGNDQTFIHHNATDRHFWPTGWVLSFKKSLAWHMPVNFVRAVPGPGDAFVVAFHGVPNPHDLAQPKGTRWGTPEKFGYSPVPWVAAYLARYGRD